MKYLLAFASFIRAHREYPELLRESRQRAERFGWDSVTP